MVYAADSPVKREMHFAIQCVNQANCLLHRPGNEVGGSGRSMCRQQQGVSSEVLVASRAGGQGGQG